MKSHFRSVLALLFLFCLPKTGESQAPTAKVEEEYQLTQEYPDIENPTIEQLITYRCREFYPTHVGEYFAYAGNLLRKEQGLPYDDRIKPVMLAPELVNFSYLVDPRNGDNFHFMGSLTNMLSATVGDDMELYAKTLQMFEDFAKNNPGKIDIAIEKVVLPTIDKVANSEDYYAAINGFGEGIIELVEKKQDIKYPEGKNPREETIQTFKATFLTQINYWLENNDLPKADITKHMTENMANAYKHQQQIKDLASTSQLSQADIEQRVQEQLDALRADGED